MKQIDFYLDFISPYAHLAFERLPEALLDLSYTISYKPVLFGALLLYAALTTLLPSLVFRTPFDVDPVEQEPAGEGESAPVAATETRPEPHIAER